jgi:transposase
MEATTPAEKEARRRLAVQRVGEGWSQQVAEFLGIHTATVNTWPAPIAPPATTGWWPPHTPVGRPF